MSSTLIISKANPLRLVITQREGLNKNQPGNKKYTDLGLPYFGIDPFYKPVENSDIIPLQLQSSFNTNTAELKEYHTGNVVLSNLVPNNYDLNGVGVYTYYMSLLAIAPGDYFYSFSGSHSDGKTYQIESEPIRLRAEWPGSLLFEWYNFENNFDTVYENGTRFTGRLKGRFFKDADNYSSDLYDNDAKQMTLLEGSVTPARLLELFRIPSYEVALLNRCLLHDYVSINGERIVSGNRLAHDYGEFSALASPSVVCELHQGGFSNSHDSNEAYLVPPSELELAPISDTQINLSWTLLDALYQTEIQYSTDGGINWIALTTKAAGITTHEHTGLTTGLTYTYRVRAKLGENVSVYREVVSFTLSPYMWAGGVFNSAGKQYSLNTFNY